MADGNENKYFKEALADFAFDVAAGSAIRHLYELGYTEEEIAKRLDYPVSDARISAYVTRLGARAEAADEPSGGSYEIIREYDEYGRSSYRKVKTDANMDKGVQGQQDTL